MKRILLKSLAVAVLSAMASLAIVSVVVPLLGGSIDGNAWIMTLVCPLVIAGPASVYTFWQRERLMSAHRDLSRAHAQLAAAHRRLADKARHDEMTGMLNRESFFATLESSRRRSDRGALLIIDADHFKRINDSFGHLTGDDALLEIAAAITRGVRQGDVLGRIGGEEFGAYLAGATDQEAALVAERIRSEVELVRFRPGGERIVPLTVSIGGTACASEATVSELMRAADKRLYEAKRRGRNLAIFEPVQQQAA